MNFLRGRYQRNEIELVKEFVEDYIKGSKLQERTYSLDGLLLAIRESLRDEVNEEEDTEEETMEFLQKGYYIGAKELDGREVYICRGFDGEFEVTENTDRILVFKTKKFANDVKIASIKSPKFSELTDWEVSLMKINKFTDVYKK